MEMSLLSPTTAAPPRVALDLDRVDLTRAKSAKLQLTFPASNWEQDVFLVIDIYSASNPVHPEGHAGWWKWPLVEREDVTVQVTKTDKGLSVRFNGESATEFWANEEFSSATEPVLSLHVVLRRTLSSSICFNDLLQVFNDKQALQATEARRAQFEALPSRPVSVPWFLWPADSTVRIVAANIFERDAVGNFALGLSRLLRANGIPCQLYASQFDPPLRGTIRYVGELLDDVEEQDLVWMNFSIFDPYLPAIAALDCRKLLYFHNITPPRYFQIYDAEYASFCAKGLSQLVHADQFDVLLANSATSAATMKELIVMERTTAAAARAAEKKAAAAQSTRRGAPAESAARRKTLGTPVVLAAETAKAKTASRARKVKIGVCPPVVGEDRWSDMAAEPIDLPQAKTLLLYVGRVAPHKRIEDLLALFARYHALDRDSALLIVGGGSFSGYAGYLQYLLDHDYAQVKSKIHFLTGVSDGQLKSIYAAATAFVTMTEHEGYCVPLVEAMSFGLPVFAYAEPAVVETLGSAGRRFHQKDFAVLAQDIRESLATPWKREQTIAAQQARLAELAAQADGRVIWTALEKVMFTRARPV